MLVLSCSLGIRGGDLTLQSVNLAELLSRTTPYEQWRAPIDHNLRRAALLAGPTILAGLLLVLALPAMQPLIESSFFLVLGDQLRGILLALCQVTPFLVAFNLASLVVCLVVLVATNGLESGRPQYHWAAVVEVLIGAANASVMALELAIVLINIVLWIVIICLCIVAGVAVLFGMASSSN